MNVERDVERVVSSWLTEEAPERAPDRILRNAGLTIDHTRQRRLAARWREPMNVSLTRLAVAGVVVVAVSIGVGWFGRSASGVGVLPGPSPTVVPVTPSPNPAVTIDDYRAARDAVCEPALEALAPLQSQLDGVFDPALSAADRAPKLAALQGIADLMLLTNDQLADIAVPVDLVAEHAADMARRAGVRALLTDVVSRIGLGQLAEAEAVDLATDTFSQANGAFENKHALANCP